VIAPHFSRNSKLWIPQSILPLAFLPSTYNAIYHIDHNVWSILSIKARRQNCPRREFDRVSPSTWSSDCHTLLISFYPAVTDWCIRWNRSRNCELHYLGSLPSLPSLPLLPPLPASSPPLKRLTDSFWRNRPSFSLVLVPTSS
jgi:hypothetical protein